MRIFLIECGGFVGVPLRYEVDVSALGAAVLPALERAMAAATAGPKPSPTSAGSVSIRIERDDGSVEELTMSHAAPDRAIGELAQRLRACATLMHER